MRYDRARQRPRPPSHLHRVHLRRWRVTHPLTTRRSRAGRRTVTARHRRICVRFRRAWLTHHGHENKADSRTLNVTTSALAGAADSAGSAKFLTLSPSFDCHLALRAIAAVSTQHETSRAQLVDPQPPRHLTLRRVSRRRPTCLLRLLKRRLHARHSVCICRRQCTSSSGCRLFREIRRARKPPLETALTPGTCSLGIRWWTPQLGWRRRSVVSADSICSVCTPLPRRGSAPGSTDIALRATGNRGPTLIRSACTSPPRREFTSLQNGHVVSPVSGEFSSLEGSVASAMRSPFEGHSCYSRCVACCEISRRDPRTTQRNDYGQISRLTSVAERWWTEILQLTVFYGVSGRKPCILARLRGSGRLSASPRASRRAPLHNGVVLLLYHRVPEVPVGDTERGSAERRLTGLTKGDQIGASGAPPSVSRFEAGHGRI